MNDPVKVAIVTEYINAQGGSDRVIDSLLKIYPDADIYTATFEEKQYPHLKNKVYTTFLQGWLFRKVLSRNISVLTPYAFEQFDLRGYDLVISISAGPSKGIITSVNQPHIGIICTPPRHQWDGDINVRGSVFRKMYILGSKFISTYIRIWDITAMKRVDYVISISKFIQKKVEKVYRRESEVMYPGILDSWYKEVSERQKREIVEKYHLPEHFLFVISRLYDYKRIDWAIKAAIETNENLVIIGRGPDGKFLKKLAKGKTNIRFIDYVSDDELRAFYTLADAFPFSGIEDYGLVTVEAMACGCPILAYNDGGVAETVLNKETGYLFNSYEELVELIKDRKYNQIDRKKCIIRSRLFTEDQFIINFSRFVRRVYEENKQS